VVSAAGLRAQLSRLADTIASGAPVTGQATYLIVFGADAATALLARSDPTTFRSGHDDLRAVLAGGPAHGIHVLAWWRGIGRFNEDIGPTGGSEVACLVALNLPGNEVGSLIGEFALEWRPRPNRALLIDRHDDRRTLIVPYVRPGTLDEIGVTA
jgi:hypothetical protein